MDNPWRVDSIQEFSCLKCPECDYFNKKESFFKDHAISNHPLSSVLFDKTKSKNKALEKIIIYNLGTLPKSESKVAVKVEVTDCVNHVTVEGIKKEPAELDSVAKDPLDFCDPNTHQEEHCMSLKTGNELPNEKDIPNPKLKPVKQKRKQSHLEIRNDYDEIDVFDNVPNIQENQPKRKQKIDNNQAPVSIPYQIADNNSCRLCDFKTEDRSKLKIHLENHIVAQDPLDFCDTNTHQEEQCMSLKTGNELPNDKDVPNTKLKPVKQKRKHSHLEIRNDYDEINVFDNEPNIQENQTKEPKKKQKIDNNQAPASISDQIANKYSCRLCDYKTEAKSNMKIHLENHIEPILDKSCDKIYDCSLCEFKSFSCSKFNYHLKDHKNYQCLNCKVNFHGPNSPALFEIHLKKSQVEAPENPCDGQHEITCDICRFKCNKEDNFKTHLIKDHEQLPFKCPKCDFKTYQKNYLYLHIQGHYDCKLCEKVFSGRDGKRQLARHMKTHKLKARTVCDFCNNPYTKHSNLKRHEKTCPKKEEVFRAMETC